MVFFFVLRHQVVRYQRLTSDQQKLLSQSGLRKPILFQAAGVALNQPLSFYSAGGSPPSGGVPSPSAAGGGCSAPEIETRY